MKTDVWFFKKLNGFTEDYGRFCYEPLVEFSNNKCVSTICLKVFSPDLVNKKGGPFTFRASINFGGFAFNCYGKFSGESDYARVEILWRVLSFIPKGNSVEIFTNDLFYEICNKEINKQGNTPAKRILDNGVIFMRTIRESWGLKIEKSSRHVRGLETKRIDGFSIKIPKRIAEDFYSNALKRLDENLSELTKVTYTAKI